MLLLFLTEPPTPQCFLRFAARFLNSFLLSNRSEITVTPEPFLPFFSKDIFKAALELNLDLSFLHAHFRNGFLQVIQVLLSVL